MKPKILPNGQRFDHNTDKDGIGRFYMKMQMLIILAKLKVHTVK